MHDPGGGVGAVVAVGVEDNENDAVGVVVQGNGRLSRTTSITSTI